MRLKALGNLTLELNSESVTSPYIGLLALVYLKLEGSTLKKDLSYLLQAAEAGKTKLKESKNETINIAIEQFATNRRKLEKRKKVFIGATIVDAAPELGCDVLDFKTWINGSAEDIQKAIKLYESSEGGFLADFEQVYGSHKLKKHYKKANDLKKWVAEQRLELAQLYNSAKSYLNSDRSPKAQLKLSELKKLLPKNSASAELVADEILEHYFEVANSIEEYQINEYIESYIRYQFNNYMISKKLGLETFKIFSAMVLLEQIDRVLIQNGFNITNSDFNIIVDELQKYQWLPPLQAVQTNSIISIPENIKKVILNLLVNKQKEYLEILSKLAAPAGIYVQFKLYDDFLQKTIIKNFPKKVIAKLESAISEICHQLINKPDPKKALILSTSFINALSTDKPRLIHFWHIYALVRTRQYKNAKSMVELLELKNKLTPNFEYHFRFLALKAAILEESNGDIKDIIELSQKALDSKSVWARAEAYNTLGKLSFRLYGQDEIDSVISYLNKSIQLWGEIPEEDIRRFGTITNLTTFLEELNFRTAMSEYKKWLKIATNEQWPNNNKLRLLLNYTMFLKELVANTKQGINLNKTEISRLEQNISKNLCILEKELNNENLDGEIEANLIFSLGIHYFDTGNYELAKDKFESAFKIASKLGLERLRNAAQVSIGEIDRDPDTIELAIHRLIISQNNFDIDEALNIYNKTIAQLIQEYSIVKNTSKIKHLKTSRDSLLRKVEMYFNTC